MPLYELSGRRPTLGERVYVAPGAVVIGDVALGDDASVWFGVVARGDGFPIRVGARTNIQDGSILHITEGMAATTVGDDVTVGHRVTLHGCTIGDRCLIGMGSTVLDHAVLGEECFLAAGSLVTPRTVIPPRSFALGRPAKVMRSVTDQELEAIRISAQHYVANARAFHAGLREITGP